jgi:hypothetical protein
VPINPLNCLTIGWPASACEIRCVRAPFDLVPRFVPSHRSRHGAYRARWRDAYGRLAASRPATSCDRQRPTVLISCDRQRQLYSDCDGQRHNCTQTAMASVNCTQAAMASVNCTQAAMASVNCTQAATGSVQLYSSAATASVQLYSSECEVGSRAAGVSRR